MFLPFTSLLDSCISNPSVLLLCPGLMRIFSFPRLFYGVGTTVCYNFFFGFFSFQSRPWRVCCLCFLITRDCILFQPWVSIVLRFSRPPTAILKFATATPCCWGYLYFIFFIFSRIAFSDVMYYPMQGFYISFLDFDNEAMLNVFTYHGFLGAMHLTVADLVGHRCMLNKFFLFKFTTWKFRHNITRIWIGMVGM